MKRHSKHFAFAIVFTVAGCGQAWDRDYDSILPMGYRQELLKLTLPSELNSSVLIATRGNGRDGLEQRPGSELLPDAALHDLPKHGIQVAIAPAIAVIVSQSVDLNLKAYLQSVLTEKAAHVVLDTQRQIAGIPSRVLAVEYNLTCGGITVVEEIAQVVNEEKQYMIYRISPYTKSDSIPSEDFVSFVNAFKFAPKEKESGKSDRQSYLPVAATDKGR